MTIKIHPKLLQRWAAIWIKKWDEESHQAAKEWANRTVPRAYAAKVKAIIADMRAAAR